MSSFTVPYSAGVDRTGTFITIDHILEQVKKENKIDIPGVINKIRHQRMKLVQTVHIVYPVVGVCTFDNEGVVTRYIPINTGLCSQYYDNICYQIYIICAV